MSEGLVEDLETACSELNTSSQECDVESGVLEMDGDIYSGEPEGQEYENDILTEVGKDKVKVDLQNRGEKKQENPSNMLKGIHALKQGDDTEQSGKEHAACELINQESAYLLKTFKDAGVNFLPSVQKKAVVICLEDSLYSCRNQESTSDGPLNLKVFSVSAKDVIDGTGSEVSVVMKEQFSGTIPLSHAKNASISTEPQESQKPSVNSNNILKCSQCPATFTAAAQSKVHFKLHEFGDGHSCQHCGRCFRRKTDMLRHMKRLHSLDKIKHQCNLCEKSYKDYNNFQQHIKTKHKGIFRYTCQDCGKGYNRLIEYKVHLSMHSGEKLYKCDLCSEEFLRKNYLTVHMRKHTGELPFQCTECKKRFIDSSKLAHHKRVHVQFKEMLKKKQCSHCPKRFETKRDLENHERTHTGDKPFSCGICDKAYSAKSSLKEHQKVHGERELMCPVCKKRFYKGFTLKEHMKIHTQEMPFVCQYCAKRYRYGSNFRAHEKTCGKQKQ